jgi:hypothetical protein
MSAPDWIKNMDWPGAIAFMLALGISLSMVLLITGVIIAVPQNRPLGEAASSLISTVFGAAIGAIATYLGSARERQVNKDKTPL